MLPPGVDLSHLQGISAPILGQPFYPLPTASHHILNPRSGTPLQLAMMQQQLQRSGKLKHKTGVTFKMLKSLFQLVYLLACLSMLD